LTHVFAFFFTPKIPYQVNLQNPREVRIEANKKRVGVGSGVLQPWQAGKSMEIYPLVI
jgi:hypothetical protein